MKGRPEFMKLLASVDVHAPAKLRVNVQVPNFDDFFTTYDVKEGDGMWRSPEELGLDTVKELFHATSRKIRSSDGFTEKSISCQD